ncbi:hypothetical protein C0J52_06320 [Blattella germanica]|nr:hypothetical protein C0J52_06320 [Blattella germanica]
MWQNVTATCPAAITVFKKAGMIEIYKMKFDEYELNGEKCANTWFTFNCVSMWITGFSALCATVN